MEKRDYERLCRLIKILIALTLAFIWVNSLMPRAESQAMSRGLLDRIVELLRWIGIRLSPGSDHFLRKLAHFTEFGILGAELSLLLHLRGRQSRQGFVNCAFAGLSAAVIDESLQLLSKRGSQVQDVLLDFCGFMAGLWLCSLIYRSVSQKQGGRDKAP